MKQSFLDEIKTTTPAGLGTASWPIQGAVLVLWVLLVVGFGEMWVLKDHRFALATQAKELARLERALTQAGQANEAIQKDPDENSAPHHRQASIERLRGAYQVLGSVLPASLWLASANELAMQLGLTGTVQSETWPVDEPEALVLDKPVINPTPGFSHQASNPHLQTITSQLFSATLKGDLLDLVAWVDALMQTKSHGRVWLHHLDLGRVSDVSETHTAEIFQMQVSLSAVGLPAETEPINAQVINPFSANAHQQSLWHASLGERPWGRGRHAPDWWRALPLSRLALVGTGQMAEASWAWVVDPRGDLHRVFYDSTLGYTPHRLTAIESNMVSLVDLDTQTPLSWVVGESL